MKWRKSGTMNIFYGKYKGHNVSVHCKRKLRNIAFVRGSRKFDIICPNKETLKFVEQVLKQELGEE